MFAIYCDCDSIGILKLCNTLIAAVHYCGIAIILNYCPNPSVCVCTWCVCVHVCVWYVCVCMCGMCVCVCVVCVCVHVWYVCVCVHVWYVCVCVCVCMCGMCVCACVVCVCGCGIPRLFQRPFPLLQSGTSDTVSLQ